MKSDIAFTNVSAPYFSASSTMRAAPRRAAEIAAHMSPSRKSGRRLLHFMIAMTGSIGAPSSMSLTPGRRRPSWKSSFASLEIEPGDHAADVVPVRDVRRPRDELAGREDGQREDHVVEVRDAAVVRVVRDEDVARAELAPAAVQLDDPLHRLVEAADEGGNARARGREIPVRVGDARAHVEHLV